MLKLRELRCRMEQHKGSEQAWWFDEATIAELDRVLALPGKWKKKADEFRIEAVVADREGHPLLSRQLLGTSDGYLQCARQLREGNDEEER